MMYANESDYKKDFASALAYYHWLTQEHEDKQGSSIPDLSFAAHGADGWIEVKYEDVVLKSLRDIKHLTVGQIDWLRRYGRAGSGHCYLLVGVAEHSYLWRWDKLQDVMLKPWAEAIDLCFLSANTTILPGLMDKYIGSGRGRQPVQRDRRGV